MLPKRNHARIHFDKHSATIQHWLKVLLKDKHEPNVLELGFGAGANMIGAQRHSSGGSVWGVDITERVVAHAQLHFKSDRLRFLRGDLTCAKDIFNSEGERDLRFDLIFLINVWEHVPQYRLKNLWLTIVALLKPNGRLYIYGYLEHKYKGSDLTHFTKQAQCFGMEILQIAEEQSGRVSVVVGLAGGDRRRSWLS